MGARTLARQFLTWQLAVVALLLLAVAGVAAVQQSAAFQETQGRRMLSLAETVAATAGVRAALQSGLHDPLPTFAVSALSVSGADGVAIVDDTGVIRAHEDPARIGEPHPVGDGLPGRARVGSAAGGVVAHVPVIGDAGGVVGTVVTRVDSPSLLDTVTAAPAPTAALLGIALVLGVGGSFLLARRVRRQTLGLEPAEIVELVQQREAMLLGVKEGVVGMDSAHRITLINAAARELLDIPVDARIADLDQRLREVLTGAVAGEDQVVLRGARVLVLNRMAVSVHGEPVGAVVTLRDRTELATLEHRLDASRHVTDTLRAQAHEFTNRLHTIAGLAELGEYDEVRRFVADVAQGSEGWQREVANRVGDPAAAALLVAKASLAAERGVALRLVPGARMAAVPGDATLSTDLVTVLGNLVDNALDAVAATPAPRWVEVGVDDGVRVRVRDSGPGVGEGLAQEVFRRGFTTKAAAEGERGLGLALARQVCLRRGGRITVHNDPADDAGAVFTAELPVRA
ncbi:sensor histidine kinase [Pseudonocardia humida]|uniref:histidine kinase n=1 Tax=Pseudonocardia humida TaxID=2800819 RepID=A0ABT0ZU14_9PSEU|nr:ATP-binding protein [Pseudonocardia humida]MCO1654226.1 Spo0B domain-containing protein [Pseudonocardia humida]